MIKALSMTVLALLPWLAATTVAAENPAACLKPGAPDACAQTNTNKDGLALKGYDPVAYFPDYGGQAVKGKKELSAEVDGVTYRFASESNREVFLADPEAFMPAYGGWCAYAMADGKKVSVDPKRFEVHDSRLYLFYRDWFTDTLKPWQKDRESLSPRADAQWQRLLDEAQK